MTRTTVISCLHKQKAKLYKMKTQKHFRISLLAVIALFLSACGGSSKEPTPTPINPNLIAAQAIATFSMDLTQTALAQPTATETPTLTPEPEYPIFDQAEAILTPEILPFVPIEEVTSGKFGEILLRMYKEGKIRQISPDAKSYPFQWGNEFSDRTGFGPPMVMYMTQGEKFFFEQYPPYSFALFQSEFLGERVALIATIWLNKDGSVSMMPQTKVFSLIEKYPDSIIRNLKSFAPIPYAFQSKTDCLGLPVPPSQAYCDYQMSVQEEWLDLVKTWVETGIMPPDLSRYPLHMLGGTTSYFSN